MAIRGSVPFGATLSMTTVTRYKLAEETVLYSFFINRYSNPTSNANTVDINLYCLPYFHLMLVHFVRFPYTVGLPKQWSDPSGNENSCLL